MAKSFYINSTLSLQHFFQAFQQADLKRSDANTEEAIIRNRMHEKIMNVHTDLEQRLDTMASIIQGFKSAYADFEHLSDMQRAGLRDIHQEMDVLKGTMDLVSGIISSQFQ